MPAAPATAAMMPVQAATCPGGTPRWGRYSGVKADIWPQKNASMNPARVNKASSHTQLPVIRRQVVTMRGPSGRRQDLQHELLDPALVAICQAHLAPDDALDQLQAGQHFHRVASVHKSHHWAIWVSGA